MSTERFSLVCFSFLVFLFLGGCLKGPPDSPIDVGQETPNLKSNTSIAQLKMQPLNQAIQEDLIVKGVVILNDEMRNAYKSLLITDSSGAIEVLLDRQNLYTDFPLNREVFIRCQGLFLGLRNGQLQLGMAPGDDGYVSLIPSFEIFDYLVPGFFPVSFPPDTFQLLDFSNPALAKAYLNRLIFLQEVEFADSNIGQPLAPLPDRQGYGLLTLNTCDQLSIDLKTSSHALFRAFKAPEGHGGLLAIYTQINGKGQLLIRHPEDFYLTEERCRALPPLGSNLSILKLRQLSEFHQGPLPDYRIQGIVISDQVHKNFSNQQIVIQSQRPAAGITLELPELSHFSIGDSLEIEIKNGLLTRQYGTLVLKQIPQQQIKRLASGIPVQGRTVTIAQVQNHPESFESQLVSFSHLQWVHLSQSATLNGYSGNLGFTDQLDTMYHFCEQNATFKHFQVTQRNIQKLQGVIQIRNGRPYLKMRFPDAPINDLTY